MVHIKFPALLLLSVLLYSICGYFVVYKTMQYAVEEQVERKLLSNIPKKDLHLLTITAQVEKSRDPDVFLRIHNGEFKYYGEMYDIVYKENKCDTTYYFCLRDKDEEQLFEHLNRDISAFIATNPDQQKKQQSLVQKLEKEYLNTERIKFSYLNVICTYGFTFLPLKKYSLILPLASPPPQFFLT